MSSSRRSLQRSCEACIRSKRRCTLELPRCARCRTSDKHCKYLNLPAHRKPLSHQHGENTKPNEKAPSAELSAYSRPSSNTTLYATPTIPELRCSFDFDDLQGIVHQLEQVHLKSGCFGANIVVHPNFLPNTPAPGMAPSGSVSCPEGEETSSAGLSNNVNPSAKDSLLASLKDVLVVAQKLVLIQLGLIIGKTKSQIERAQHNQPALLKMAQHLWSHAPKDLPKSLDKHEAWIFAESLRRTIVLAWVINDLISLLTQGYYVFSPFVDSLPFDARRSVWHHPSDSPWLRYIEAHSPPMMSYSELVRQFDDGQLNQVQAFEHLLLLVRRGWRKTQFTV